MAAGSLLQDAANTHDYGDLGRGRVLADADGGGYPYGYEEIGCHVMVAYKCQCRSEDDGESAEDYGHGIERVEADGRCQCREYRAYGNGRYRKQFLAKSFGYLGYLITIYPYGVEVYRLDSTIQILENCSNAFVNSWIVLSASPCSMPSRTQCWM